VAAEATPAAADLMDSSGESVTSALKRARATLRRQDARSPLRHVPAHAGQRARPWRRQAGSVGGRPGGIERSPVKDEPVVWDLMNMFKFDDRGRLVEEIVRTDNRSFLRQLGAEVA
jgi:hypothetical protein